jgi:hypothetical protein
MISVLWFFLVSTAFFLAEFFFEWNRLGRPDFSSLSWSETNNAKLVDVLSPMARAYNNILAMLIATIGLAIPLTANMHTPKLIEMFLSDKINRWMLGFFACGAAHVLWVDYLIGPAFAPLFAYRLSVVGALIGWVLVIPYFFYVVRFLDPSNIIARLQSQVLLIFRRMREGKTSPLFAHDAIHGKLQQVGTLIIKAIDRADRSVVYEGIWSFKQILDQYGKEKETLPNTWFIIEKKDFVGLSKEAIDLVNQQKTWFEHRVMTQLTLAYKTALSKSPDSISAITEALKVMTLYAAQRGDREVLALGVRFFNNFLREAIAAKNTHAIYDLFYQYRLLISELAQDISMITKICDYILYYLSMADAKGVNFTRIIAAFDLKDLILRAATDKSPSLNPLLDCFLKVTSRCTPGLEFPLMKALLIVGSRLTELGFEEKSMLVRERLVGENPDLLIRALNELESIDDPAFWEVTDRQVHFEWIPTAQRPALRKFLFSLSTIQEARATG